MRIVFAGTPEFAADHLKALVEQHDLDIVGVVTQPDKPGKRGKRPIPSAVKTLALDQGLPIYQPKRLRKSDLASLTFDLLIVVAYGQILKPEVLAMPSIAPINVHASLLPRWRGAAPIQHAILAGDQETGVSIMEMEQGLDTGPVILMNRCAIDPDETGGSLFQKLSRLGAKTLIDVIKGIGRDGISSTPQMGAGITYAGKISKQAAKIDWTDNCTVILRKIRAFLPDPVAFSFIGDQRFRFFSAESFSGVPPDPVNRRIGTIIERTRSGLVVQCGDGQLCITGLQLPTGKGTILQGAAIKNIQSSVIDVGQCFQ